MSNTKYQIPKEKRQNLIHLKMKYFIKKSFIPSLILCCMLFFFACGESEGPTVPGAGGNPLAGAYVLYGTAGSTDYAYYDAVKDSVTDYVFTSSNPGRSLNINPGEIKLNSDRKLYITALGMPGGNGTIYKIDPIGNNVIDSLRFGSAPDGFAINNNRIVVGNSGSTNVTVLDLDFNIIKDTVEVGSNPANVLYGFNKYIVTRSALNNEPSAAFIDEISYGVVKLFFPHVPVSAIYNINGIFLSTNLNKNIYRVDPETITTTDSFVVPTVFSSIEELVFRSQNSFYAVIGQREVWLGNISSGTISFTNIYPAQLNWNIRSAAYESNANELYLGVHDASTGFSFLVIIDGTSGTVKRTKTLLGLGPAGIVFRYF